MSVAKRTLFYTRINGNIVFNDWCMICGNLGTMIEPLPQNRFNADGQEFDPAEENSIISEMKEVDFNALLGMSPFADTDGTRLHGGALNPRTGF